MINCSKVHLSLPRKFVAYSTVSKNNESLNWSEETIVPYSDKPINYITNTPIPTQMPLSPSFDYRECNPSATKECNNLESCNNNHTFINFNQSAALSLNSQFSSIALRISNEKSLLNYSVHSYSNRNKKITFDAQNRFPYVRPGIKKISRTILATNAYVYVV